MFRKNYFTFFLAAALFLISGFAVLAQTAPVRGRIEMKTADGTKSPVADALVEPFRTDAKGKSPTAKTNKKGEFSFAGLPFGQTFVLSISAPNIKPALLPNVKAGMENLVLTVEEGDGKRWTEAEVRQTLSANSTTTAAGSSPSANPQGELTAEQKKAQAEYEKQVADVTSKNENIKQRTAIIEAALKAGNEAFSSKNYDVAVAKFDEGFNADPDFAGSAPVLLNNKGAALNARAVNTYNQSVKAETSAKVAGYGKVRKDLADAADAYSRSWTILSNAPATEIDPKNLEANKMTALRGAKETFRLMAATEQVDNTKTEIGRTLLPEYMKVENDPVEKGKAQLILGDVYRVAGDSENAIVEYKKALETSADNLDALAGVGLSLVNLGYMNNDKTKMQEGANYLQRFASAAPDSHKYKADAMGLIETLKKEQNVTPQKSSGSKKKN
jgi:tetratricopeptide (TPR) repeat protein